MAAIGIKQDLPLILRGRRGVLWDPLKVQEAPAVLLKLVSVDRQALLRLPLALQH